LKQGLGLMFTFEIRKIPDLFSCMFGVRHAWGKSFFAGLSFFSVGLFRPLSTSTARGTVRPGPSLSEYVEVKIHEARAKIKKRKMGIFFLFFSLSCVRKTLERFSDTFFSHQTVGERVVSRTCCCSPEQGEIGKGRASSLLTLGDRRLPHKPRADRFAERSSAPFGRPH
jgi:hypothetical protein